MSNTMLTHSELKDRMVSELGLDSSREYSFQELMQSWMNSGQPFDKNLIAYKVDNSGVVKPLAHNTPVYAKNMYVLIPPTDSHVRIETTAYIMKTSGNTSRGIARLQLFNVVAGVAQDGDSILIPLENLANEGVGMLKVSHIADPAAHSRIFGCVYDTFQYAGALTAQILNGGLGAGVYAATQVKAYLV